MLERLIQEAAQRWGVNVDGLRAVVMQRLRRDPHEAMDIMQELASDKPPVRLSLKRAWRRLNDRAPWTCPFCQVDCSAVEAWTAHVDGCTWQVDKGGFPPEEVEP